MREEFRLDTWVLLGGEVSRRGRGEKPGSCFRRELRDRRLRPSARQTPREPGVCESPDVSEECFTRNDTLVVARGTGDGSKPES